MMEEIPKSIQLLWGLDEPGSRGPKKGLSLMQVVDAAIEVCDAEGFAALSMSRLAKQLGFTTMSLYRYVDSKDTLIDLVSDRVIGPPPTIPSGMPWREALEIWAMAEFESIRAHPWWLEIPMTAPPAGPNNMGWLEAGLAAFSETSVPDPIKLQLVMNMSLHVISRTRLVLQMTASSDAPDNYAVVLAQVLDPERFPALLKAISAQAFDMDEANWEIDDFKFGLARLLDGFERYVESF
jgi:AcrR family transcriptional regulator